MKPKKDMQTGFDASGAPEKSLSDDPELMYAAQRLHEAGDDMTDDVKTKVKEFKAANANMVELVKTKGLPNGRYRVGEFVLEVKDRNGGGFDVPAWESKAVTLGVFSD